MRGDWEEAIGRIYTLTVWPSGQLSKDFHTSFLFLCIRGRRQGRRRFHCSASTTFQALSSHNSWALRMDFVHCWTCTWISGVIDYPTTINSWFISWQYSLNKCAYILACKPLIRHASWCFWASHRPKQNWWSLDCSIARKNRLATAMTRTRTRTSTMAGRNKDEQRTMAILVIHWCWEERGNLYGKSIMLECPRSEDNHFVHLVSSSPAGSLSSQEVLLCAVSALERSEAIWWKTNKVHYWHW